MYTGTGHLVVYTGTNPHRGVHWPPVVAPREPPHRWCTLGPRSQTGWCTLGKKVATLTEKTPVCTTRGDPSVHHFGGPRNPNLMPSVHAHWATPVCTTSVHQWIAPPVNTTRGTHCAPPRGTPVNNNSRSVDETPYAARCGFRGTSSPVMTAGHCGDASDS